MKNLVKFIPSVEGGGVEKNLVLLTNDLSSKIKNISIVTANNDIKIEYINIKSNYIKNFSY